MNANRKGASTLIVVLVVMMMASSILLGLVATSIRHRRQTRNETQLEQTLWLLDAGIGATINEINENPDFESFEFSASESLDRYNGEVKASLVAESKAEFTIRVTARLQGKHKHSPVTQRSRVFTFDRTAEPQDKTN